MQSAARVRPYCGRAVFAGDRRGGQAGRRAGRRRGERRVRAAAFAARVSRQAPASPVRGACAGGANGMVSGATAPPLMMKLIAWSTVQSVGVIFSTGTISR